MLPKGSVQYIIRRVGGLEASPLSSLDTPTIIRRVGGLEEPPPARPANPKIIRRVGGLEAAQF